MLKHFPGLFVKKDVFIMFSCPTKNYMEMFTFLLLCVTTISSLLVTQLSISISEADNNEVQFPRCDAAFRFFALCKLYFIQHKLKQGIHIQKCTYYQHYKLS